MKNEESSNSLKYIWTIVEGQNVKATLDGGSQATIIDYAYLPRHIKVQKEERIQLSSASGHEIPIVGKVQLPIRIGRLRTRIEAIVVRGFDCPLLLSIAMFNQLGAQFDYATDICRFFDKGRSSGRIKMMEQEKQILKSFQVKIEKPKEGNTEEMDEQRDRPKKRYQLRQEIIMEKDEVQYWTIEWCQPQFYWWAE